MKALRKKRFFIFLLFFILLIPFSYIQNNVLTVTDIPVESQNIPAGFDGYRIVQLSDLHSKSFGDQQQVLAEKVKAQRPDVLFFTGDLIDLRRGDEENGYTLMEEMMKIAPVYFVTGNHEWQVFEEKEKRLREMGVNVLRNESVTLQHEGDTINLIGIDDPLITETAEALQTAWKTMESTEQYTILLSHRPELFSLYADANMDLTFTGHAHGGQIRIPFVGGLFAPGQGFFPDYTAGAHTIDSSTMIVNRGLGNSMAPQRIFNRPEIVVTQLKSTQ
ncbi:metallophosphoesterase [Domibacillus iocasae]|uniref:Phosphoesterase n=1 Tax=Domibacillus iocasae TaxID=1714016 RepID=A0A1E7DU20_9BACI|nr:phosphoesterase [Domibacillus iocasae]